MSEAEGVGWIVVGLWAAIIIALVWAWFKTGGK
jgi:hypothetical protein